MGGVSCTPQAPVDPTKYTITFDSQGGSEVAAQEVAENVAATAPEAPTKDGYTFVEWLNGETAYDWTSPVTGNLTLTAKWAVEKYTIDYKLPEGSTNDESNLVEYTIESETISELKDPKLPEGFTFLGWYTDENCTEEFVSIEKGSTGDVVIYAKYTDKQTFTVTYYIGDKANTKLEEKDAVFKLTGYDLFTDKECTKAYKDPITSDTTLYAKVKKMTVKFDSDGGSAVADAEVDYNTVVAKPTDPTKAENTFQGWTLDGKAYDFSAKVTKNITLKATWKANAAEDPEDPADPEEPTTPPASGEEDTEKNQAKVLWENEAGVEVSWSSNVVCNISAENCSSFNVDDEILITVIGCDPAAVDDAQVVLKAGDWSDLWNDNVNYTHMVGEKEFPYVITIAITDDMLTVMKEKGFFVSGTKSTVSKVEYKTALSYETTEYTDKALPATIVSELKDDDKVTVVYNVTQKEGEDPLIGYGIGSIVVNTEGWPNVDGGSIKHTQIGENESTFSASALKNAEGATEFGFNVNLWGGHDESSVNVIEAEFKKWIIHKVIE